MSKVKIDSNAFTYPMPMTLVGAILGDRPNFLAVAWVTRVNYKPPVIAVALGKTHFTNPGIRATKAFSVMERWLFAAKAVTILPKEATGHEKNIDRLSQRRAVAARRHMGATVRRPARAGLRGNA